MGMTEELAADLTGNEPEVDLDAGTVDGEVYKEPEIEEDVTTGEEQAQQETTPEPEQTTAEGEQTEGEPPPEGEQDGQIKTVPQQALHAERKKNQELREKIDAMEYRFTQVMQALQQRQPGQEQAPEPEQTLEQQIEALGPQPDEFQDPNGHDEWTKKVQQLRDADKESRIDKMQTQINQQEEERLFNQTLNHLTNTISQNEQTVKAQHPEYDGALQFLRQKYIDGERAKGRAGSDEQFLQEAFNYEIMIGMNATMQGRNAAQLALELAKQNGFIYEPPGETTQGDVEATPEAQTTGDMEKIDNIQAAQERGKTPGSGGKAATLDSLSGMSDDDFSDAMAEFMKGVDFDIPIG